MKALIQRVSKAKVTIRGETVGEIGSGILVFLGILKGDNEKDALFLAKKIAHLRIFETAEGKMQNNVISSQGKILVISQFTLAANCKKGHRPDFLDAAPKEEAIALYEFFIKKIGEYVPTTSGVFGEMMEVELVNQGPATFLLDSINFYR